MTLDEIKTAVQAGKTVHWANTSYTVVNTEDQWLLVFARGTVSESAIGLTWRDGVTMKTNPDDFFTGEE